ncbi:CPBP family intramembrane glutamic endopeptidase [Spirulina sp. 06S082]|nr:CPBP family intramembrane glutamic endopeptidase [Spirulina sp. 06S082]MEA5470457.1 CPBP family intramembrane glutamic endopeptidase [Spirulina sp. 06S082]
MNQSEPPEFEPLTRTQVLIAMAVTAIILLVVAKVWQSLGSVRMLALQFNLNAVLWGLGLAGAISIASAIVHRLWPAYRRSANYYLELVIKPLMWPDLIWLGLLPGLSEELLFRGVMLPAFGLNIAAVILSSIFFGVLHLSGMQQWPYMIWATIVGGILGFSAIATGNLLVPIVAHVVTNFVSGCWWKSGTHR